MNHRRVWDRHQTLLLPERLEDYIAADNPVRFLDAFVASLDLRALGFAKATVQNTGRPPYAPADLLRLYLYGYLHRVRSSRLLEAECHRNLEVLWLLGKLAPDHKTIADFRKDNRQALQGVTRQFTLLCQKLELFGGQLAGIDGTKLCAVNSKDANFNEKKLNELIERADRPNVGMCVDSWHVFRGAGIESLADLTPEHVFSIQLNDGPIQPVLDDYVQDCLHHRQVMGEGEFDLGALMAMLPAEAPVSIEVPDDDLDLLDPGEVARRLADATRALLA